MHSFKQPRAAGDHALPVPLKREWVPMNITNYALAAVLSASSLLIASTVVAHAESNHKIETDVYEFMELDRRLTNEMRQRRAAEEATGTIRQRPPVERQRQRQIER